MTLTWNKAGWRACLAVAAQRNKNEANHVATNMSFCVKNHSKWNYSCFVCTFLCSYKQQICRWIQRHTRTCTSLHAHHFITCCCRSKKDTCRNSLNQCANHFVGLSVVRMTTELLMENSTSNKWNTQQGTVTIVCSSIDSETISANWVDESPFGCGEQTEQTLRGTRATKSYLIMSARLSVVSLLKIA